MKKLRTAVLVTLALAALAPTSGRAPHDVLTPVETLEGSGFLGSLACYTCVIGAVGGSIGFPAVRDLLLEGCYGYCAVVM